jgi:hypothetical protein
MKHFKNFFSCLLGLVLFFSLAFGYVVSARFIGDPIPKQSQFGSVISNTGESIIYGSVLDSNKNIANIIVSDEVLDAIKQLGDQPIELHSNSGLIGRSLDYPLIRNKNIKRKKIRGKIRRLLK